MIEEIHNLLKIENDKTTIFTNNELKMIDDYIKELESYKYNMDRDYLRLEKELEEKNKPQIFIDTQDIEERYAEGLYQDYLEEENKKYKNQQKEFIEWLENEKNIYPYDISDYTYEDIINTILSKYNEIIEK